MRWVTLPSNNYGTRWGGAKVAVGYPECELGMVFSLFTQVRAAAQVLSSKTCFVEKDAAGLSPIGVEEEGADSSWGTIVSPSSLACWD
jgi:hypothetical protein